MDFQPILDAAAQNWFWSVIALAFVTGGIVRGITRVCKSAHEQRTRREIAAYVAEGSLTVEQGERLMAKTTAGRCWEKMG